MNIKITTYLALLNDILIIIKTDLKQVKNLKNDKHSTALMCLYCTIYEDCFSCMVLIKQNLLTAVSHILRNMLEAFIDFINLFEDENYLSSLELDFHNHRLRILKDGLFEDTSQLDELIKGAKDKITEIENTNGKALTIKSKFKQAGLENLYNGAYIRLCGEMHNNLAVLMDRSYNAERDVFMLVNERPIEVFAPHVDTIFYIIAEATEIIYKRIEIHNELLIVKIEELKDFLSNDPFQLSN